MLQYSPLEPPITTRRSLIYALREAAGLEHALSCQYMFAAFSLKQPGVDALTPKQEILVQRWKGTLLAIAREEMQHFGQVLNLLTAIGGPPNVASLSLPHWRAGELNKPRYEFTRFDYTTLTRLFGYESPPRPARIKLLSDIGPPPIGNYDFVSQLYARIRDGFKTLSRTRKDNLFIGKPSHQLNSAKLGRGGAGAYGVDLKPICNVSDVVGAIDFIVEQGEGASSTDKNSHHARLGQVRQELINQLQQDPIFVPARTVACNPYVLAPGERRGTRPITVITAGTPAANIASLANMVYEVILIIMDRVFGGRDETNRSREFLAKVGIAPMMTAVLRPLAETLTLIEIDPNGTKAGIPFQIHPGFFVPQDASSAWLYTIELLQEIAGGASILARQHESGRVVLEDIHQRVSFIHQQLSEVHDDGILDPASDLPYNPCMQ